jgi:hypothetical protein
MFDVFYSGIKPNVFAHEQQADSIEQAQALSCTRYFWWVNYLSDYTDFDFSFEPKPWESQHRHAWPSQHQRDSETYLIPKQGYSETNYKSNPTVCRLPNKTNWNDTTLIDISWHPDPADPPYIYQFGTQWQKTGGPIYYTPGATEIKYIEIPRAVKTSVDNNWITPDNLDTTSFDYTWHPDSTEQPYIYQFGTQWQKTNGPTYHTPGATEIKYITAPRVVKTSIDNNWITPDNVDITTFDYTWHPDSTEQPYIYQFATQHQKTGGPQYIVPGATDIKYIDQIKIKTERVATAIYEIDHMDRNKGNVPNTNKIVRYFDNYLDTLKRIANSVPDDHEFIWICSSVCDYTNFDFSWHPELWQAGMLQVFPSDNEKFGDTFFMHVPTFKYRAEKCQLLEWYDLNFTNISVPRRPLPVVVHTHDTHVEAIKTTDWAGPLAVFSTGIPVNSLPTVPLWREKTKTVVPLSPGASAVVVPKSAVPYIKTQAYDYPYIDKTQKHFKDEPLDIVFIDNGEPNADDNFKYLKWAATRARQPRIHRSSGVNGRVAAYCAAANLSTTPWFFAVFAKLEVDSRFDWSWQPDRLQEPKHYIFHALNPVNGLEYGHQAMIAYNKKLVLENTAPGLDFTLDQAHEVVPILSGTANYHYSKWVAWRTAFREVVKLKHSLPNVENEYRLTAWLDKISHEENHIENGEYSVYGAEDAVEYYDSVKGNFTELKKSYDWAWLASYAFIKRGLIPDQ